MAQTLSVIHRPWNVIYRIHSVSLSLWRRVAIVPLYVELRHFHIWLDMMYDA